MGYITNFNGKFDLDRKLSLDDYIWLKDWNDKRHDDTFPSNYCQWIPTQDGKHIEWDGGEKFYEYTEWLLYLIENFFDPKGYTLSGEVEWYGEEQGDVGKILVKDNKVVTKEARIVWD